MNTNDIHPAIVRELLPRLPELRTRAAGLQRCAADAEDLLQDTIERALRRAACLEHPGASQWLGRVMFNAFVDGWRNRRRMKSLSQAEEQQLTSAAPYEPCLWEMFTEADVRRAMEHLPLLTRRVMHMAVMEKRTYKDIAEELGVPVPTVGTRLHRARQRVKQILLATPSTRRPAPPSKPARAARPRKPGAARRAA